MIGLFLGDTDFASEILKKIKKLNVDYFIIDLSKNKKFKNEKNFNSISIGQFGRIINLIKKYKCKKVLFAGKVNKPKISSLKLDFKGLYYIPRIIKATRIGDAAILKEIISILKKEKIEVISSITFNPELTLNKGCYTKLNPNKYDLISINKGLKAFNKIDFNNHVQGVVVRNSIVIGKETNKGTKRMLLLIKKSKNSQGILIKFPKKNQDLRVDLPTVGLDTLKDCKRAGIKGIVLKAKQNIFMDKTKSIKFANKNNIFIVIK